MYTYLKKFIRDEDGVEAMEWMAIVAVAAALIAIAASCGDKLKDKLSGIANSI